MFIGFIVIGYYFAARTESDIADHGRTNAKLLKKILLIGNTSVDDDVRSKGESGYLNLCSICRVSILV